MVEEREPKPSVDMFVEDMFEDLKMLRMMNPATISVSDVKMLQGFALKYGITEIVKKENFYFVKGRISEMIRKDLKKFVREDLLERERELDTSKTPRSSKKEKTEREPKW